MACTKEEIEKKRLAALQIRQSKLTIQNNATSSPVKLNSETSSGPLVMYYPPSTPGRVKNYNHNASKTFHPYAKPECSTSMHSKMPLSKVVSGTIYLISDNRFEVNPSEFCTPLINIFKSIPSRNYDAKSKLWNFSIDDYEEFMSKVSSLAPHVVLGPIPSYVLKVLCEHTMDPNSIDLSPIESTLRNKLMPFQEDGVRFGIARRGRCMIADDMGLGKTFQALAIASYYKHNWPLLIGTTSSMRETWQSKIHELLPSVPMMNIATLTSGRDTQLVADKQDESHYLKSHKAQCTVALNSITRNASRVLLLSGTPALSRPAELYTQLTLIEPRLFPGYTEYGKRYCAGKQTNFGWDMTGQSNLAELQVLLQKKFLIRRTKEQVLTKLEGKIREAVILDQSLLDLTKEDQQGLLEMAQNYKTTKANEKHAALITFFSESAKMKIPAICKYIKQQLKEEPGKFLIFAHHKNMVDAICLTFDEEAVHYICIVGSTPANVRADLVDKFQHSESCRVAVLSITAASSGLTLTAANLVLFAELHWNPGILTQAESRAHRIGQTGGVCVRYLLANGTSDDFMWPMLQDKLNVLNNVGLSEDNFEDTKTKHQESKTNIIQYLSSSFSKNERDYIPGTNIRHGSIKADHHHIEQSGNCENSMSIGNGYEAFLDDEEGDELLANLVL
ncbi:SWI/SNF-related matrix-associated actin-dependent regulator of chromatin subfamily A-like protein 1 isoform X2 [Hyposmocoma kahamanoa]|uniref:SWI/SNF-related matrix-associated actin-dependent regulator of chromatin subfamily A-like protein 1 isoform X2 n=1 Tax=Hyposmocoma kahamanoa TaxID=1477025 RepID=UPI000E6D9402|nr:SWI/SNF-related matrix-associated actin-dependent regulator of chromatin subfamily A-like protein 1 isoform X2 [Hyposmocoma kahamanoa]